MNDKEVKSLAVISYRNIHTDAAISRIEAEHGDKFWKERGPKYHGRIVEETINAIKELGYDITKANEPTQKKTDLFG